MSTIPGENWTQLLQNPRAIQSLYASPPSFALLHELTLHREGPRVELRLELDRFADTPARSWHPSFNRVQVVLCFDDLQSIDIDRWGWHGSLTDARIERHVDGVKFWFTGPDVAAGGTSLSVAVNKTDGYLAET